ncbi:MAG: L7Ae/L30e/S12e/Gadd45 family ribosomal protein [Firmicutes bacterium]|nr:L7Ae/L30e/S12e/Gadd45 family ribosomal protein [Bacillota bacterium]
MNRSLLPQGVGFLLGLCRRAGRLAAGHWAVESALRRGAARLVIVAEDAGASALRRHQSLARDRGIPVYRVGNREELGRAVGLEPKAVLAVTDGELARKVREALDRAAVKPLEMAAQAGTRRERGDSRGSEG